MSLFDWKPEEDCFIESATYTEHGLSGVCIKQSKGKHYCTGCNKFGRLREYYIKNKDKRTTDTKFPGFYCSVECFVECLNGLIDMVYKYESLYKPRK